jgi:hypothetical protein
MLTVWFDVVAIGRLPGERSLRFCVSGVELEYWRDCRCQTDQVDGSPKKRIARDHGAVSLRARSSDVANPGSITA